jgi:cytochrome c-type biogenesis protein CcmF
MWNTFPLFGSTLLLAIMVVASYTFAVSLSAGASGRIKTLHAARLGAYGTVALIGVSVLSLAYAFVSHDFRLRYVAHYSDRSMPTAYLLTALWGGQDGSLLWWLFLLSLYIGGCVWMLGKKHLELQPYVLATLMGVVIFFCVLMAFAANPFATGVAGARADGEGLNPLLQNFYMIIHPPSLYTGFVGCSIPFAFGVAALATGRLDAEWFQACRKFTLFALLFLAIGNTLGMLWAYEELGWGGYWAWDPVENAAFMPMLSLAAFVHSVMIQERRGMMKVWNVFLICLTFFMTIFGTFLTRSGAIASVHSFAQSSIGEYFLWFLVMVAAFCATLIMYRWPELRNLAPETRDEANAPANRTYASTVLTVVAAIGGAVSAAAITHKLSPDVTRTYGAASVAFVATFLVLRAPFARFVAASPTNLLRAASMSAGWIVTFATAPGVWVLSSNAVQNASARVAIFSILMGIQVYAAAELVFRRITSRLKMKVSRPRMESIFSREFTFVLNNFGLLGIMLFILVATTFPMVSEALWNEKVTVGPPYYNAWMQPLGLGVFFLMGMGTLFGWKKTSTDALKNAFVFPVGAFFIAATLHFLVGSRFGYAAVMWSEPIYGGVMGKALQAFNAYTPVIGFSLCVFNVAVIAQEYYWLYRARLKTGAEKTPKILWLLGVVPGFCYSVVSLPPASRRRYGGYLVHLGIALMFFGFTGKSWNLDKEMTLSPGQTVEIDRMMLEYVGPRMEVDNNKRMIFADVRVWKKGATVTRTASDDGKGPATVKVEGQQIAQLSPAKFIYKKMPESPTTEVAMLHSVRDDLYLVVGTINPQTKTASFQIHLNALVGWIWFGALMMIFGSFVCMWPELEPEESRVWQVARGVGAAAASTTIAICLALLPVPAFAQPTASQHAGSVEISNVKEKGLFQQLRCMCGTCPRELLSTCACSTADQTRERLRMRLARGESAEQIIDEYTKEFGTESLSIPPNSGGMRAIYAVPLVALLGVGAGLGVVLKKWRSNADEDEATADEGVAKSTGGGDKNDTTGSSAATRDAYDERIDAELRDLDG